MKQEFKYLRAVKGRHKNYTATNWQCS